MKIAVAGMGYVGLSLAVLLAQHSEVMVFDLAKEKVHLLNARKRPSWIVRLAISLLTASYA